MTTARDDLRHLVACPSCKTQYDASGYPVGARFRCACGSLVEVGAPRPREAAVVRCSSCGAPREGRQAACRFCGADFTIHEQDLHTVCPLCMTLVSDRALYCHACGAAIAPLGPVGSPSSRRCPVCESAPRLVSRELGTEVPVLECPHCAGLWLGAELFRRLERQAREHELPDRMAGSAWSAVEPPAGQAPEHFYRPCVECGKLMNRRNYGRRSGIIVDVCAEHGLWFDQGELENVLRWIREGGLRRLDESTRLELAAEERRRREGAGETTGWLESQPEPGFLAGLFGLFR